MCEYCTYANYPSSLKCTMCQGSKPLLNEDIFRLNRNTTTACTTSTSDIGTINGSTEASNHHTELPIPAASIMNNDDSADQLQPHQVACGSDAALLPKVQNTHSQSISQNNGLANRSAGCSPTKWHCSICTYLNWPRAQRCTQCLSARDQPRMVINSPSEEIVLVENQLKSIRALTPPSICGGASAPSPRAKDHNQNNTTGGAAATSPVQQQMSKWKCSQCTYENWPKSQKCSMCTRQRDKFSLSSKSMSPPPSPPRNSPTQDLDGVGQAEPDDGTDLIGSVAGECFRICLCCILEVIY